MADLRPMEFGEILDGALTLFRRHFGLFLKLSLAVMWLPIALGVYLGVRFFGLQEATPEETVAAFQTQLLPLMFWGLVTVFVYVCAMLVLTAGSIRIISDSYLEREPQFGEVWRFSLGKIVPLFLVGLGKGLLLTVVMILCVLVFSFVVGVGRVLGPAFLVLAFLGLMVGSCWLVLYVASGYMVTTPTVVLEPLSSAFDSFGRSWELTRGMKLRVLGLAVVGWLISVALPGAVRFVISMTLVGLPRAQLVWSVASTALPILLAPILPCVLTLAYYDLRVRREAFDLQLLSGELGAT